MTAATALGLAVVVGTVAVDLVASDEEAATARASVGNSGANIAVRLAQLGWQVELIALVGDDHNAALLRTGLSNADVGMEGVVSRPGYHTPQVFQVASGHETGSASLLLHCPRCRRPRGHRLLAPEINEVPPAAREAMAAADLVISDLAHGAAVEAARRTRGLTWYEASLQETPVAEMTALAHASDIIKCSSEEADHFAAALHADGPRARIVTAGAQGARGWGRASSNSDWEGGIHRPSVLASPPVDTIGAGDAFSTHAATSLAQGANLADALDQGGQAAARACGYVGALGDIISDIGGWISDDAAFQCWRCDVSATSSHGRVVS